MSYSNIDQATERVRGWCLGDSGSAGSYSVALVGLTQRRTGYRARPVIHSAGYVFTWIGQGEAAVRQADVTA
jgi:hypothetical protein